MGSGASADASAALTAATADELKSCVASLDEASMKKLKDALVKVAAKAEKEHVNKSGATVEDVKATIPSPPDECYGSVTDSLPSLSGKCYVITGCTSGTGFWSAVAACKKGVGCLIMANRSSDRAVKAEEKVKAEAGEGTRVVTVECDLQSFASVKASAAAIAVIAKEFGGLDGLVCNAGVMGIPDKRTSDGYDIQMQTNHLSHFLLTQLLMPSLEAAAETRGESRVVQHSSGARGKGMGGPLEARFFQKAEAGGLGGDDLMSGCFGRYHQTKLANTVFAMALHEKLKAKGSKVKSLVAEPGVATTDLMPNLASGHAEAGKDIGFATGFIKNFQCLQSAADGACSLMCASFAADASSGDFYMPGDCLGKDHQHSVDGTVRGVPVKTMAGGQPNPDAPEWIQTKYGQEALTMDEESRSVLWSASEAASGEFVV